MQAKCFEIGLAGAVRDPLIGDLGTTAVAQKRLKHYKVFRGIRLASRRSQVTAEFLAEACRCSMLMLACKVEIRSSTSSELADVPGWLMEICQG